MKKLIPIICIISAIPFLFCSCFFNKEVESIVMNKTELTMNIGDSSQITVSFQPDDAKSVLLNWSSSNENVATVSNDGIVKAVDDGSAVITAMTQNGIKTSCNITVSKTEVESIKLDNESTSVKVGKNIQLIAKLQPTGVDDEVLEWSSSDEKIAVVNSSGYVTGVKKGTANIVCTSSNGKKASCTVTVKDDGTSSSSATSKTEPEYNYNTPRQIGDLYSSDFVFYDSSYRKLSSSELVGLSDDELQRAINEIYARNGYVFNTTEFQDYYSSKSWYYPNPNFSTSDLNSTEQANIALLSKYR